MPDPDIKAAYEDLLAHGWADIESHMAILRAHSVPSAPPDGTAKQNAPLGKDNGEWRMLPGVDMAICFYIATQKWREERVKARLAGDKQATGSMLFWNVLCILPVYVNNPGFEPHWHRQYKSPLGLIRAAGIDAEWRGHRSE